MADDQSSELRKHILQGNRRAIILGATGATGRHLLSKLLQSQEWSQVTTIGRRPLKPTEMGREEEEREEKEEEVEGKQTHGKLTHHIIDMDTLGEKEDIMRDHDVLFCCLGTTRSQAGTADNFRKVDFDYVAASAKAAKEAGISHYSLVSSQGANPNTWSSDLGVFHSLLYLKTKGRAEEVVRASGIPKVSVFRPGLLNRGGSDRFFERLAVSLMSSIHVSVVADAMIYDAESERAEEEKPRLFMNPHMFEMSKKREEESESGNGDESVSASL